MKPQEDLDMDIRFASGTDITIPEGVRSINRLAGKFNSPVVLPKSLERIGQDAFYCTRFSSPMIFPENVAYIGPGAFLESNLPGRVEIPPLIDCVKARSFNCTQITDVIVGDNVLQIEDDAFGRNGALRHVELGKNLEYIGKGAFSESPELETIVCFAKEPPTASEAFSALKFDRTVLEVPAGCVGKYRNAPGWNQFSNITEHRELAFNIPLIECLDKGVVREGVLRAEGAWRVKECPDWVTVSPSSGEAKDQLTVRVASQAYGSEAREGEIVFQLDNNKDYTYSVGVRQLSHSEYGEDTEIVLQTASADGDAVPVMIVGEGFTASQITSGEYLARMNETMEQFFDIEPYHSLRDHFTVTTALACSPEEGVSDYTVTKANRFGTFGLEPDESRLRDYVTSVSQVLSGRMDDADQMLKSKNKKKFRAEHQGDITAYEKARNYLQNINQGKRFSSLQSLTSQLENLQNQQKTLKQNVKYYKDYLAELKIVSSNVDAILEQPPARKQTKTREEELS